MSAADEAVEPAEAKLQRCAEQALARSWLSQRYPIRVTPLAYLSVGPLSLLLEVRGRQCMPEVLESLGDLGESLILRTRLRLPRRCNGRVRKLFRRGLSHKSSPSVECGAPTVGEPAAPDGELRAQTPGAASQGGAK
ncbi:MULTISPECIES: hypothetical protein [Mycobacteroides]|uniref:hypothetical protein n=1 Tax=Mycobacteroides TaxID=670516 RepID=UPI00104117BB|nr:MULTISPECIES: hypothetical protein [Mycobacteroides]MDM2174756.1 hypothetical protein [Mycobacteroides abscessus]MBV0920563.1 hypothetical protein [Mycobacteroides chelonae]MDM2179170.1 hypothetical protein [Mycobacteroides abscessus]MDM2205558.1 hypothetical protein [Mycobacteroides abscessus]MDM2212752.1 hypothetical protein [Mycobacteroides abscessus]